MKRTEKLQAKQVLSLLKSCSPVELIRQSLRSRVQVSLLKMVDDLFQQELALLCGARYEHGKDTACKRAGSEKRPWNRIKRSGIMTC